MAARKLAKPKAMEHWPTPDDDYFLADAERTAMTEGGAGFHTGDEEEGTFIGDHSVRTERRSNRRRDVSKSSSCPRSSPRSGRGEVLGTLPSWSRGSPTPSRNDNLSFQVDEEVGTLAGGDSIGSAASSRRGSSDGDSACSLDGSLSTCCLSLRSDRSDDTGRSNSSRSSSGRQSPSGSRSGRRRSLQTTSNEPERNMFAFIFSPLLGLVECVNTKTVVLCILGMTLIGQMNQPWGTSSNPGMKEAVPPPEAMDRSSKRQQEPRHLLMRERQPVRQLVDANDFVPPKRIGKLLAHEQGQPRAPLNFLPVGDEEDGGSNTRDAASQTNRGQSGPAGRWQQQTVALRRLRQAMGDIVDAARQVGALAARTNGGKDDAGAARQIRKRRP